MFRKEGGATISSIGEQQELLRVSRGEAPADLFFKDGLVVNVYSGEIYRANVAVYRDRIAYIGPEGGRVAGSTTVIDARGLYLAPGYVDPHGHPWVLYNPVSLAEAVLPRGTTTVIADNLPYYLLSGEAGFQDLVASCASLPLTYYWLLRPEAQSPFPGDADFFLPETLKSLGQLPRVVGLAEVVHWTKAYAGDPELLAKIATAKAGHLRVEGHNPGCSYTKLGVVAAAGVDSCHEAVTPQEAVDRLRLGFWTILRYSPIRPDLPAMVRVILDQGLSTGRVMFTPDGPNPIWLAERGYLDECLRLAVQEGMSPVTALQAATINPAVFYGLDHELGGLAPGRRADLVLLSNLKDFEPQAVYAGGRMVASGGSLVQDLSPFNWQGRERFGWAPSEWAADPGLYRPRWQTGRPFPVMQLVSDVITRLREVDLPVTKGVVSLPPGEDLTYCALLDRGGGWVTNGLLAGLGARLEGLASSLNSSGHVVVIGENPEAMAQAARRVFAARGGVCLVDGGGVKTWLPLEVCGLVSAAGYPQLLAQWQELCALVRSRGYSFDDFLYTLFFLACDVIPDLRLTAHGLMAVKTGKILAPARCF